MFLDLSFHQLVADLLLHFGLLLQHLWLCELEGLVGIHHGLGPEERLRSILVDPVALLLVFVLQLVQLKTLFVDRHLELASVEAIPVFSRADFEVLLVKLLVKVRARAGDVLEQVCV